MWIETEKEVLTGDLYDILSYFSRDELRSFAKEHNIKRGQNKEDLIDNICEADKKVKICITLE